MSFALTTLQVLAQEKDVTRRMGWEFLKVGDLLQPVKKCMGLRPGEKLERLGCPIRVVSKARQPLDAILALNYGFDEIRREGFAGHPEFGWPAEWVQWFATTHKCSPSAIITRIEFVYTEPLP